MSQPPVVKMSPLLQLYNWVLRPLQFFDDCQEKYGDCFMAQMGKDVDPLVVVSHPDAVAYLFNNIDEFDVGCTNKSVQYVVGDFSTLLLDGEPHKQRRKLLLPPFHGDRMRNYGQLIVDITRQQTEGWQPGQIYTMLPVMSEITFQVIMSAVFGLERGDRHQELKRLLQSFLTMSVSPAIYAIGFFSFLVKSKAKWSPVGIFMQWRDQVDHLIFEEIRDRRANFDPNKTDILTLLLSVKDEDGNGLSDQELRDELITMLVAGHDSSAATIAWALYQIAHHSEVQDKLIAEIDAADSDPVQISRLPYLSAVCNESLRLRAAGPTVMQRLTKKPITIQGYEIPANRLIAPSLYLTHRRPDIYPNPEEFQPDRFLNRQYSPSEFYPFGGANRYCIGAAFAQFEMRLVIATILRQYRLTLAQSYPIRAVRRGVNVAPEHGVKLKITRRPVVAPAVDPVGSVTTPI
jgi:cytochrome P450 family 110